MLRDLITSNKGLHIVPRTGVRGFTIIEIIVVLSIVVVTSTVVLFNYNGSRRSAVLSATALDIANMIRIAQIGGRSSSEGRADYTTTGENVFSTSSGKIRTGASFSISSNKIDAITIYRGYDLVAGYQSGSTDRPLEVQKINAPITVTLCASVTYSSNTCVPYGTTSFIEFSRLSSNPVIDQSYKDTIGSTGTPTIQVTTGTGSDAVYRYIIVERTGNIFVK
jgi:prepilin-type N-terminal cleavage/methylation domain-containing protein